MNYDVFAFSFNNPERKARMNERFSKYAEKTIYWVEPVELADPRVEFSPSDKRTSAIMFSHLDMIRAFLEGSSAEYGIFCEDDIYIRKDFKQSIQVALQAHARLALDVLLAGYLINYKPVQVSYACGFSEAEAPFIFISYSDDVWGAQMYILDRQAAVKILDRLSNPFTVPVFNPDWTITKFGRRAAMYPMLALEEGAVPSGDPAHVEYHNQCKDAHYDTNIFD
jgi:hypothetical protein